MRHFWKAIYVYILYEISHGKKTLKEITLCDRLAADDCAYLRSCAVDERFFSNAISYTEQLGRRATSLHGAEKEPAKSNSRLALFDHILHRLLTPPSKGTLLKYITRCIALARSATR